MDAINLFIRKRNYRRYLEIGSREDGWFGRVEAAIKVRKPYDVTSAQFFERMKAEGEEFDVVLVDGSKQAAFAFEEIAGALDCLCPRGAVFVRDCLPEDRDSVSVWRAFLMCRSRPDLDAIVGDFDRGVGLIRKIPNPAPVTIGKRMGDLTFEDFEANREAWMRPQPRFVFEVIAEQPWGIPTVAILVIGKSDEEIEGFKAASPHVEQEARMVYVSNPGRRYGATAVIANPFLDAATEDVVAIVHADTTFEPGAVGVFAAAAIDNNSLTGIVGRNKPMPGDPTMGYTWCAGGGGYVSTLDSCSAFFRRTLGLRFDGSTFDDFHCVIEDLCLQARAMGVRALVPHAKASHVGTATEPTWNDRFWRYRQKLLDKYPREEIHTV